MAIDIHMDYTILEIVKRYPETQDVFTGNGFPQFADESVLNSVGRFLKLKTALDQKQMDRETFLQLLVARITDNRQSVDVTLKTQQVDDADVTLAGLLPCPVRVPLLEIVDREVSRLSDELGLTVSTRFEAASGGMDPFADMLHGTPDGSTIPDLFLSAGFETFFGEADLGRFRRKGFFRDPVPSDRIHDAFQGLDLPDPTGSYGVIGVVPAVFLVNLDMLAGRPVPTSWEDLLNPVFERSVSLPVGDFDLFNAMLLTLHARYQDDGIRRLGRAMLQAQHPSQMVKQGAMKQVDKPAVTIMPYFFTRMAERVSTMAVVWPADGAILSPIFMAVRADRADRLAPLAAIFKSREVGELLAHRGLFPSTHPDVENRLPDPAPFMWIGWERIDGGKLDVDMKETLSLFQEASGEVRV